MLTGGIVKIRLQHTNAPTYGGQLLVQSMTGVRYYATVSSSPIFSWVPLENYELATKYYVDKTLTSSGTGISGFWTRDDADDTGYVIYPTDNTDSVSIGTNVIFGSSKLSISGDETISGNLNINSNVSISGDANILGTLSANKLYFTSTTAIEFTITGGSLNFLGSMSITGDSIFPIDRNVFEIYNNSTYTKPTFLVTTADNVGIFVNEPTERLSVSGNIMITGNSFYIYNSISGIHSPTVSNYLSQVTTSGGIVTAINNIDVGTLTTGLAQYWDYSLTNNYYKPVISSVDIALDDNASYGWGTGIGFGDTKIIGSDGNYIRILVNSTTGITVSSNGNVGIGTNNPQYKLDITGNIRTSSYGIFGGSLIVSNTRNYAMYWGAPERGYIGFPADNKISMINANVGIGTTTPTEKLSVSGNIGVSGTISAFNSSDTVAYFEGTTNIKGNLNVDGFKNFRIDHPNPKKENEYWLIHTAIETNEPLVTFRFKTSFDNFEFKKKVLLPDYWQYLIEENSVDLFLNNKKIKDKEINLKYIILNKKSFLKQKVSGLLIGKRKTKSEYSYEIQKYL